MPQGLQAIFALVVLLPGFVSARIVRMMSAKTPQTELERVIEALIFSFFTYVCYVAIFGALLPFEWTAAAKGQNYSVYVYRWRLISIALIAVVLGFIWGYIREHDLVLKNLRNWKVTRRSSNESVWTDVFLSNGGTVQVGLGDGRSVIGWLKRYAESGEERTLFLERARWISQDVTQTDNSDRSDVQDDSDLTLPGDGLLLLTEKAEIKYVMFLDERSQ